MPITFDPEKSSRNAETRRMPFEMAEGFDFDTAVIREDIRFAYPEPRFQAIGLIGHRTVMLVFTPTADGFRVISPPRPPQGARAMARKSPVTDDDAPVLTDAELAEMRPAREVLNPEQFAAVSSVRKRGRPIMADPKVPVTIRLDAETVATFKATGPGWQTRMNDALAAAAAGLRKG